MSSSGVLSIALPVPVVVSNFEQFYQKELNRRRQEQDKRDEEKKKQKETKRLQQLGLAEGSEVDETSGMLRNGDKSRPNPTNV